MENHISEIKKALSKYDVDLSNEHIHKYLDDIQLSQQYFPLPEQRALMIKLLNEWESRRQEKIITVTAEA